MAQAVRAHLKHLQQESEPDVRVDDVVVVEDVDVVVDEDEVQPGDVQVDTDRN